MIREACDMAADRAAKHHRLLASVRVSIECGECPSLNVARHELVMAIANLIHNGYDAVLADEDNQERRIEVTCRAMPRSRTKDVKITVSDNGVGMPTEMAEVLREGTPGVTSKRPHGTGFGVAIARRTVERYEGQFSIESTEGEGTIITMELPRRRSRRDH